MKITKLHIENFESIRSVDVEIDRDMNILIGRNNSGKSNIIDAFKFLSESATQSVDSVNTRGGFTEIVFGKDERNEITFDLEINITDEDMSNLHSKLQLESVISLAEFESSISNKIRYFVKFGANIIPIKEQLYIYFNKKEIIYAEGYWDGGHYISKIIKDLKAGIIDGNWELENYGSGAPPTFILRRPRNHSPVSPKEKLLSSIYDFLKSFYHLNPVRFSSGDMDVLGGIQLASDGSNLPQVLNSIASKNKGLFEKITASIIEIAGEITEIRAPLKEGKKETYLCITEKPFLFKDTEFLWKRISSGVQELLFLVVLLHTTPKGSLLMIEEPEIHLHPEAIFMLLKFIEKICEEEDKQILITTHSPMLVDALSFDKIHVVTKINGMTQVKSILSFTDIEMQLIKSGILKSWVLLPNVKSVVSGKFILVVENNVNLWTQWIKKSELFPNHDEIKVVSGGGWSEAVKLGVLFNLLKSIGILSLPFKIILDSDSNRKKKEELLLQSSILPNGYHILARKEIEEYLLDPVAIAKLTNNEIEKIEETLKKTKGGGKEKLTNVFKKLGFEYAKMSETVYQLIIENMDKIPEEISKVMEEIKSEIKAQ